MPEHYFWLLIVSLALIAAAALHDQRQRDREVLDALNNLAGRVKNLESGRLSCIIPPPFPLPPVPELPPDSKPTRLMTRVWRRG